MAEERGFSIKVTESEKFLSMPVDAQCLYFHLGMIAEKKGIVRCAASMARALDSDASIVKILVDNHYLNYLGDGIYQIVHYYENNGIGENADARRNWTYRKWREAVIERDQVCQICGTSEKLVVHHIKRFADYPELRFDVNNGITLCDLCHRRLHGLVKDGE